MSPISLLSPYARMPMRVSRNFSDRVVLTYWFLALKYSTSSSETRGFGDGRPFRGLEGSLAMNLTPRFDGECAGALTSMTSPATSLRFSLTKLWRRLPEAATAGPGRPDAHLDAEAAEEEEGEAV